MPFDKLKMKHITGLIQYDPITCVYYYNHCMKCFQKIVHERWYDFWTIIGFVFVTEFQNHGNEHDRGLLWVANAPTYYLDFNKIIENLWIRILHVVAQ
jgi:hypothetical protein